jgi:hypothetical protein
MKGNGAVKFSELEGARFAANTQPGSSLGAPGQATSAVTVTLDAPRQATSAVTAKTFFQDAFGYAPVGQGSLPTSERLQGGEEMASPTREEIKAEFAAAEARTDAKFAQLIGRIEVSNAELKGEFKALGARLDGVVDATRGTKATTIATGIAAVALIVAVLAFGQQWFGFGLNARDLVHSVASEMQKLPAPK